MTSKNICRGLYFSAYLLVCIFCNLHTCCFESLYAYLLVCTSLLYSDSCSFYFQLLVSSVFGFQGCLICIRFHMLSINRNENPIQMQSQQILALLIKYGQPHSTLQSVCIPMKYNLKIKLTQSLWYVNYMGKNLIQRSIYWKNLITMLEKKHGKRNYKGKKCLNKINKMKALMHRDILKTNWTQISLWKPNPTQITNIKNHS